MNQPLDSISNLVDLLRYRASAKPGFEAYTWLSDQRPALSLTYQELDLRARSIAILLESAGARNQPVVVAYPAGLEFIVAFFGCLYAGAIAVPVYPPGANRGLGRLTSIIGDCGARFGLTTAALAKRLSKVDDFPAVHWLTEDDAKNQDPQQGIAPQISSETLALLQYTSGSTGNPKGVMVSHGNILANERAIQRSFRQDESSIVASWLPMTHDMGLIGGVLQPLYSGARSLLFSPAAFVQDPARWLRVVSTHRATTSGGPDFAYRLCSRKVSSEEKAGLDLSCWRVAFNGAEPVRRETLNEFSEKFRDCGFRREAFHPCYGLAESTLLVSCAHRGSEQQSAFGSQFTSCGPVIENHSLRIVNWETGRICGEGSTGEIWVSGPSVAQGYWGRREESDATFCARLAGEHGETFLRTGDLGFLDHGELVVAGRLKDLIIIRGQNYYPEDIEASVDRSCPGLSPGSCVALAIEDAGDQRIIVVQEIPATSSSRDAMISTIRRTVAIEHEIRLDAIILVPRNAIPRTASGKVRRRRCRQLIEKDKIEILAQWKSQSNAENQGSSGPWVIDFDDESSVCEWLAAQIAVRGGLDAQSIDPDTEMTSYGIDSLTAAEFCSQLATYGVDLDFTAMVRMNIRDLAALIVDSPKKRSAGQNGANEFGDFPLSRGQYALWLNQQLDATSSIYNLAIAARTTSAIGASAGRRACKEVAARHPILRASFPVIDGQPVQRVPEGSAEFFEHIDTQRWETGEVERHAALAAYQPFDLATGPLVRVIVYGAGSGPSVVLVAVHHIISDFTSLALLVREILLSCGPEAESMHYPAAPFSEYVRREARMLNNDDEETRLWEFWQQELTPLPNHLELPVKHGRKADPADQARWEAAHVGFSTLSALRRLSTGRQATLYATLVAAFQVLLHRYSGQSDFAIATPVSLRDGAEFRYAQGYFINPVILRASFSGDPTFTEFLDQTQQRILRALDHRHLPFGELVRRLQPVRTARRPPLADVLFTFLAGTGPISDSALFGLGVPGVKLTIGEAELESLELRPPSIEFDLTFMVAEGTDGLHATLGYNQELFSQETAVAMLRSWELLLEDIAKDPASRISTLQILSAEEIRHALVDFNDTAVPFDKDDCIHHAFERKAIEMPAAVAVSGEGMSLTYADLNDRANRLASYLRAAGVHSDDIVGICLRRSPDLLVGLLGILKSGAAYLPLDANYPAERIAFMLSDSGAKVVVAHKALTAALQDYQGEIVCMDRGWLEICKSPVYEGGAVCRPENLAYVIYTSGSTGVPKGVMIAHRNVANFFAGMDRIIGSGGEAAWLAVTSVCFDISVLELLWTVTRGVHVLLDSGHVTAKAVNARKIAFSLFYFASDAANAPDARYQLLLEGAKFADENGFEAIWTPERHFHTFGGTYPNPAVVGAALAVVTKRVHIRAGSVVLPLHHPVRVAEDWSVVDNLSKGRVGISFASGWHADDFVLAPSSYAARREIMYRDVETVRRLWRGEQIQFQSGTGNQIGVRIYPAPRQRELPVWITSAGTEETFRMAGELGANVLTHLLGQSFADVARNVRAYRSAWQSAGHPEAGRVTLMLHTFVAGDQETARETVREPMIGYLKDSVSLIKNFARSIGQEMPGDLDSPDMKALLASAFERYFETSGLFGAPERCLEIVEQLKEAEIDEVACLIDFGVEADAVLESLRLLAEVKRRVDIPRTGFEGGPTHFQCTPSLARMLLDGGDALNAIGCMLVGGEALPAADAERLTRSISGRVYNMYGPTETCIWSTSDLLNRQGGDVSLGSPLANTRVYVTGQYHELVPIGASGEICIGGEGVARGYLGRSALTAARFIPDPFSPVPGARMYCTGDRGVLGSEGRLHFLGRFDDQVKLRGHRIELGEIENAISRHPDVREAAAMVQSSAQVNSQLYCYVVPRNSYRPSADELREFLMKKLPEYMLPANFIWLEEMPRTPNGKLDRTRLASAEGNRARSNEAPKQPQNIVEEVLAELWATVLGIEQVGVDRSFFEVGGHSLLAVRLLGMVREIFHVNVDLGTFFTGPTITALAGKIQTLAGDRAQRYAELFKTVAGLPEAEAEVMLSGLDQQFHV
jgi:natural product biosynthesis luciferase-like monooxygenase protein